MGRHFTARVIFTLAATASLALLPVMSASAATTPVSCKTFTSPPAKLVAGVLTSTGKLTGCTPTASTGGTATNVTTIGKAGIVNTTTWGGGKGKTVAKFAYKGAPIGNCPTAYHLERVVATGTVTSSTNKAVPKGAKESATICLAKNQSSVNAPGTTWKF